MDRYVSEIKQLRGLGFAEGLPIGDGTCDRGTVARLESGRIGVAVEFFRADPAPRYAIVALDAAAGDAPSTRSHRWDDIVRDIHLRMPPNDND